MIGLMGILEMDFIIHRRMQDKGSVCPACPSHFISLIVHRRDSNLTK
jgi:hypothetical protein